MGLLDGKHILVTGITSEESIAFEIARIAQQQGATVVVTAFERALPLARRAVERLETTPELLELDVTNTDHLAALADQLRAHVDGRLDGVVHSVAFASPQRALGGQFLNSAWEDVSTSLHISAYSLQSLTMACRELLPAGASVVGLTFDAAGSWPGYDWMGVSKAALESVSRYLARYLGPDQIRCNLVAAGPLNSIAKQAIPGHDQLDQVWDQRAPLGWDTSDATAAAKAAVALLSEWFPATTGEIIHVDGGLHSTNA